MGRLLMPLILAAEGYPPLYVSGALLRNRTGYYDALNHVQLRGDWSPWITLVCRAVVESTRDTIAIALDFDAMLASWQEKLDSFRSDSVARRLAPMLLGHPVVDAARVAQLMDVSDRSARTGIDALVEKGILRLLGERKRNRVWESHALIDRFNRTPDQGGAEKPIGIKRVEQFEEQVEPDTETDTGSASDVGLEHSASKVGMAQGDSVAGERRGPEA